MKDILEDRRLGSDAQWAARNWAPVAACVQTRKASSTDIKTTVFQSTRLKYVIQQLSEEEESSPDEMYKKVSYMLDEMGYNRELPVLRWLGLFTAKILKRLCSAIYINEETVLKVKAEMGKNPVLFVPTHRSYGDFILLSYVCFHYEIDIPRIAAGMDFHGMTILGQVLRDSCAFFMRRTFSHDKLYSATFSEYVQALLTHGDAAVEFFIEGTRSRTSKSLMPKFGFLSMALKPYFTGLVPDISVVPINFVYDRCLEEALFAYELLGVPKPKESTKGFIKAMGVLKDNYGKVFINFGTPISVKEALGDRLDRSVHGFGPVILQELTSAESQLVVDLAHDIVSKQRELTILTCFNVVACVLGNNLSGALSCYTFSKLIERVRWLYSVFRSLEATVDIDDVEESVRSSIVLHQSLVCVSGDNLRLVRGISSSVNSLGCLKGAHLKPSTMEIAIPFIMLQNYVNPCCQYLVHLSALIFGILVNGCDGAISISNLKEFYSWFRTIFCHEFVLYQGHLEKDFQESLRRCYHLNLLSNNDEPDNIALGKNSELRNFLINFMGPFLPGYHTLTEYFNKVNLSGVSKEQILKESQELIQEKLISHEVTHPANLSLDLLTNAIQSLCAMGALSKRRKDSNLVFIVSTSVMPELEKQLAAMVLLLPRSNVEQLLVSPTSKL